MMMILQRMRGQRMDSEGFVLRAETVMRNDSYTVNDCPQPLDVKAPWSGQRRACFDDFRSKGCPFSRPKHCASSIS